MNDAASTHAETGTCATGQQAPARAASSEGRAEHAAIAASEPASGNRDASARGDESGDETQRVLSRVLAAHETWFDVTRDYEYAGHTFAGYAEFHSHGEQYVLVKRAKMWEVDNHEYLFFLTAQSLGQDELASWIEFMKTQAIEKVDPQPNHMSSCISLVIIAAHASDAARKTARRARFRKNYALGLRGWADLRVALVDLSTQRVYTNAAGKTMKATLEANIAPVQHAQESR